MWQRQEIDLDCLVPGLRILIIMHILLQFTQQIFRSASYVGALLKMLNDVVWLVWFKGRWEARTQPTQFPTVSPNGP